MSGPLKLASCHQGIFRTSQLSSHIQYNAPGFSGRRDLAARNLKRRRGTVRVSAKAGGLAVGSDGGVTEEDDYISKLLAQSPSLVEPRILIGGKLYTAKEVNEMRSPLPMKVVRAVGRWLHSRKAPAASPEERVTVKDPVLREDDQSQLESSQRSADAYTAEERQEKVYLKDLLREFRGNLYVPEEAFRDSLPETDSFRQALVEAPEMSKDEFWRYERAGQVKEVVAHAVPVIVGSKKYAYRDLVVELQPSPGEATLQHTTWAMRLGESEAKTLLAQYSGTQREVESPYSAYVALPEATPSQAAATISSRVSLELSALLGLAVGVVSALGSVAVAIGFAISSVVAGIVSKVVWPITAPILRPISWIVAFFVQGFWGILIGIITDVVKPAMVSLYGLLADGAQGTLEGAYRKVVTSIVDTSAYMSGPVVASSLKQVFGMTVVGMIMAALAKFTLTRNHKDFAKWDLWQAIQFGQSKPQARVEGTGVKFADVGGLDEVVDELKELVSYLKNPSTFATMGTKPPHGVLLYGPPGCGKTLIAKAIAGEAEVPFYQMAGSEFSEALVGVGPARVRDLFKRAKINKPAVVFVDEIDALGLARGGMIDEARPMGDRTAENMQEKETTLNQLLIELDGFDTGQGVIFIGATNRMDMLDAALLRPGRFDRKISIQPPKAEGRLGMLHVHSRGMRISPTVDLARYARNLPGWSGAQIAQLMQEAALGAARRGGVEILRQDMDRAVDRLTLGVPRAEGLMQGDIQLDLTGGRRMRQQAALKERMAVAEIGLGLVALLLRRLEGSNLEPPMRMSIVPRGETLSQCIFDRMNDEQYMFERLADLQQRLQVFLGGRAAEAVLWGHDTSNASLAHLGDATWLAYKIICVWNLGEKVTVRGTDIPWIKSYSQTGPSQKFEGGLYNDYGFSDSPLGFTEDDYIAEKAKALLDEAYAATQALVEGHGAAIAKAIYVILEKGELYGEELEAILDAYPRGTPRQLVDEEADRAALPPFQKSSNSAYVSMSADIESPPTPAALVDKQFLDDDEILHPDSASDVSLAPGPKETSEASAEEGSTRDGSVDDISNSGAGEVHETGVSSDSWQENGTGKDEVSPEGSDDDAGGAGKPSLSDPEASQAARIEERDSSGGSAVRGAAVNGAGEPDSSDDHAASSAPEVVTTPSARAPESPVD